MNLITIEFCAEDRARIDRLAAALEARTSQVSDYLAARNAGPDTDAAESVDLDAVQQKLAEAMAKASASETTPAAPAPKPADEHSDEVPWEIPAPAPVPAPSLEEFQKALTLRCAESDATKAKVRALLHEYAAAASQVPEGKRAEVLERLAKL